MTKSVTSMVVGRAVTLGLLDIDRPIGVLYPEADAEHARLTPRHPADHDVRACTSTGCGT